MAPKEHLVQPQNEAQSLVVQGAVLRLPCLAAGRIKQRAEASQDGPQLLMAEQADRLPAIGEAMGATWAGLQAGL